MQLMSPTDALSAALLGTQRVRECSPLQGAWHEAMGVTLLPVNTFPRAATSVGPLGPHGTLMSPCRASTSPVTGEKQGPGGRVKCLAQTWRSVSQGPTLQKRKLRPREPGPRPRHKEGAGH